MTVTADGQVSLFDLDTWSGKTYPEHSAPATRKERTSQPSSKRSSKSANRKPVCLCVYRTEDGQNPGAITLKTEPGVWPGGSTMHSTTVYHSGEKEYAYWLTSADYQPRGYCLTLNLSERPRVENPSRLSEVLEQDADERFWLSAKACQGILNRAERRGKELPEELHDALVAQAHGLPSPEISAERREELEADRKRKLADIDIEERRETERYKENRNNGESFEEYLDRVERENPLYELLAKSICDPSRSDAVCASGFDGSMGAEAGNIGYAEEQAITTKSTGGGHCLIRR